MLADASFEEIELSTLLTILNQEYLQISSEMDLFLALTRYAEKHDYGKLMCESMVGWEMPGRVQLVEFTFNFSFHFYFLQPKTMSPRRTMQPLVKVHLLSRIWWPINQLVILRILPLMNPCPETKPKLNPNRNLNPHLSEMQSRRFVSSP